jgi:NAD-dependent oxidoreductase involved in siderophore biosynthesis
VPEVILRSSLLTTPWPVSLVMFSVPFPLSVRSDLEKIAPSTVLSSVCT